MLVSIAKSKRAAGKKKRGAQKNSKKWVGRVVVLWRDVQSREGVACVHVRVCRLVRVCGPSSQPFQLFREVIKLLLGLCMFGVGHLHFKLQRLVFRFHLLHLSF